MSQVAACRDKRQVIPIPYAPGGCPVKLGEEKCGETQGLDIIKDFHQLYQEKMSQIDVSAGGDSLQEKVDLQQKWIDDLTEQNRMLARVIAELETEAIGRLQQLENKLQNAAKSFSEEDVEALAERDRKIKELEEALNSHTSIENDVENDSDRKSRENATQGIGSDKQREETKFESKDSDYSGGRKDEDQIKQEIRKIREQSSKDMPPGDEELYEDGRQKQGATEGSTGTDRGKAEDSSDEKRKSGGQSKYSSDDKKKNDENYAMKQDVILSSPSFTTQDDDTSDLPLCPVRKVRPCSPETCRKASIKLKEIATSNMNKNYPDSPNQEEFTSTYSEKETKEKATPTICPVKKVPCTSETCKKNSRKSPEPTAGVRTNSIVISVSSAGKQDASRSKLAENLEKKSVHLLIENNKENMIVEPEKDHDQGSLDISKPRIESVPVIGVQDSLEILKGTVKTQSSERSLLNEETQNSECICETKNYVDEFMKLKEENKMFREGEEIRRLKNELDEKMKRILELNEENRTLNEMVNALKCNQVDYVGTVDELTDSEPTSSEFEYCRSISPKRGDFCTENCINEHTKSQGINNSRKSCLSSENKDLGTNVYQRKDKDRFTSDSSSTICKEDICPFVDVKYTSMGGTFRARGGNDTIIQTPTELMEECTDYICPNKDMATDTSEKAADASVCPEKKISKCTNVECQTECNEVIGRVESTRNKSIDTLLNVNAANSICYDPTCTQRFDMPKSPVLQKTAEEATDVCVDKAIDMRVEQATDVRIEETTVIQVEETTDMRIEEATGVQVEETTEVRIEEATGMNIDEGINVQVEEVIDVRVEEAADVYVDEAIDVRVEEVTTDRIEEATGLQVEEASGEGAEEASGEGAEKATEVRVEQTSQVPEEVAITEISVEAPIREDSPFPRKCNIKTCLISDCLERHVVKISHIQKEIDQVPSEKDKTSMVAPKAITDKRVASPFPKKCNRKTCLVIDCLEKHAVAISATPEQIDRASDIPNEQEKATEASVIVTEASTAVEELPAEVVPTNDTTIKELTTSAQEVQISEKDFECDRDICRTCPSEGEIPTDAGSQPVEVLSDSKRQSTTATGQDSVAPPVDRMSGTLKEETCDAGVDVKPPVTDATTSAQVLPPGSEPASVKQPVSTTSSAYGSDLPTEEEMKTEPLTGEPKDTSDEMPTASMKSTDKETPVSEGASVGAATPIEIQGDSGQKMPDDGTPTEVQEQIDQKIPQDSTTPTEGQKDIEQKVPTDAATPTALPEQEEQKTPADAVPPCAQSEKKKPSTADKSCQEPCICLPDETTTKDSGRDDSKPQQPPRVSEYAAGEADKKLSPVPDSVVERPETSEKPSVVMGKGEEPYPAVKEEVSVNVEEKSSAEEKEEKKPEAEDTEKASTISKGEDKPTSENEGALMNIGDMTQPPEYEVPQTKSSEKPPTIVEDITASSTDEKPLAVSEQEPSIIVSEKAPTVSKDEDKPTSENEGGLLTIGDMTQPPEYEVPQTKSSEKPPTIVEDITPTSTDERAIDVSDQEPSIKESEKVPTIAKGDDIQTTMDEKLPTEASKEPSTIASEKPSVTIREVEPSPITSEKPSVTITEVGPTPIASEKPSATVTEVEPTPIASEKPSVTIKEEPTTTGVIDKPSKDISEKPSDIPSEKDDGIIIDDFLSPEKRSMPTSDQSDKVIIRCICKSKYCKIVPDPNNPNQKLCVDVSETLLEAGDDDNCMCLPSCPRKDAFTQNSKPDVSKGEKEKSSGSDTPLGSNIPTNETRQAPITPKDALVYTTKPRHEFEQHFSSYRSFHSDRGQSFNSLKKLSKEQEYAGLSRKETEPWKKTTHIPPRKSASAYGIQEDATDTSDLKDVDETKNADLKIVIADLKNKLLDAEDKIEELKNIKNFGNKDNNTALIMRYSEEIDHLKKSLKWTSKEKEEYEFLKQKVKLLEQGKGDTDNITSNLQTAEDRSVMKVQLKKLSKKNKCYEEIVQFFKEEMSVMSDELLTLQEVLNVTNVSSQEENTKLINAILQLRRINDRLVSHLCEIEKQVVLENQINQINEARINELQNIIGSKNNDLNQHDQTIQEMRKKLNNATKQNADLKKTIKNLTDAVVEIQEGIKSVERDHNRNKNDASVVESNVCLASGNLKDIKCCIENKNDKIIELENKLKSQEVSIILATKELDVLKEKKADYKKLVVSLKEQLASYDKKNEEMMGDFQLVSTQLQDYVNLDHMKNYEIGHYKSLVEEMKMSLMQLNQGLEKFEASNIHFYEDMSNAEICCDKNGTSSRVFSELKKSMADMKRRLSDAEFKGGLIEEELLKVKESHMSQIREEVTESQKELETRILASIEEQANLNMLVEQQKEEIEHLKKELHREKLESSNYKQNLSKLQNENMTSNAQMEILHLKCELNKSLQRQRVLSEENDKIHSKMISLRKKLSTIEEAYEIMKQENEENKMQLKKTLREKEYIAHKNQELTKNIEDMRSSHDQLERQCRSMMKRMSQEKSWVKKPMQQPFSPRHYTPTPQSERRSSSPSRNRGQERNTCDVRYRSMSPWRNYDGYNRVDLIDEDAVSRKSHQMRNISYDSNPSAFSSRSPSPRSDYLQEEVNNLNLNDWFSPNFKETDTDADEGDDEMFINKLHVLTAQVQEANKRWQQKMNTNSLPTSRGKRSN
ncbi:hypothetical protein WA026_008154 [Henosepilachna vigintioctopunctata]|uniref:Uncharacterized protein n=1 Tax=Henosepilachna vigintioctopunctata TaxID=420089 RepID=A0AAW1TQG9_9CUCU